MTESIDHNLDIVDPDLLPPQIRCFAKLISLPETLILLRARGGLPTYISADPNQSQLREILSKESCAALSKEYPGVILTLPKADKVIAQLRNHYIVEACRTGERTGRQVALETGLTYRMIKKIKAKAREAAEHEQMDDLFALDNPPPAVQGK